MPIPTEYDDVHTAENTNEKPQITITSPRSSSIVSPPRVSVVVDIGSAAGTQRVDYYLNDELVSTVSTNPFHGSIPLSDTFENGSVHTIKAVVYDDLLRSNQSTVSIKIGSDDTPPQVSIGFPKNNSKLTAGASVGIQVEAFDGNGDISNVKYYLDGKLIQNNIVPPFDWQLKVPSEEGTYELKVEAYDQAKNRSSDSIEIQVVEKDTGSSNSGSSGGGGTSRITSPGSNSSFDEGDNVNISGVLSGSDQENIQQVVFYAKKSGQSAQEIATLSGDSDNASYSIVWDSPPSGTYEIYMKVVTDSDSSYTNRVPIVVGN